MTDVVHFIVFISDTLNNENGTTFLLEINNFLYICFFLALGRRFYVFMIQLDFHLTILRKSFPLPLCWGPGSVTIATHKSKSDLNDVQITGNFNVSCGFIKDRVDS